MFKRTLQYLRGFFSFRRNYILLSDQGPQAVKETHAYSYLTVSAIVVCVFCMLANVAFLPTIPPRIKFEPALPKYVATKDLRDLRYPSQFIGLDTLDVSQADIMNEDHESIVYFSNHPFLLAQINRAQPDKVFSTDPKRQTIQIGTISPEEHQVQVTKNVSRPSSLAREVHVPCLKPYRYPVSCSSGHSISEWRAASFN